MKSGSVSMRRTTSAGRWSLIFMTIVSRHAFSRLHNAQPQDAVAVNPGAEDRHPPVDAALDSQFQPAVPRHAHRPGGKSTDSAKRPSGMSAGKATCTR